jgi:hypothetical protein
MFNPIKGKLERRVFSPPLALRGEGKRGKPEQFDEN